MEFKYLTDGRKVVVVGQLNNIESIVQEVFVTESGDEIPSGEKFTTKSLHDEPVVSWKVKDAAEQEARLQNVKFAIEKAQREQSEVHAKLAGLGAIFKQSRLLSESLEGQDLDTLISVMSGTCEYLVIGSFGVPKIIKFEDALIKNDDYGRYQSLKLLTLMGASDGNLSYRVSQYSDGSGGGETVYPCPSKKAAVDKVKEMCLAKIEDGKFPTVIEYKKLKEMGVLFNKAITEQIKTRILTAFTSNAETSKEKYEEGMDEAKAAEKEAKALFF